MLKSPEMEIDCKWSKLENRNGDVENKASLDKFQRQKKGVCSPNNDINIKENHASLKTIENRD